LLTAIALITSGILKTASWTGTTYISISEEPLMTLTVLLLNLGLEGVAGSLKRFEDVLSDLRLLRR